MVQYTLVGSEDGSNISVFIPGQTPQVAHSSHPNFDKIVAGAIAGDESILGLFDVGETANKLFLAISERVTYRNGRLYFDGDEVNSTLTRQIVRFINEDNEDFVPLVLFMEKVNQNPSEHSREQLFDWLDKEEFTITDEGDIVGYKGVKVVNGEYFSVRTGKALVDGEEHSGSIPNFVGSEITMPRGSVTWDPATACSTGLHVGTYTYAKGFSQGAVLEVHVNPRDVVSVPTDANAAKMRTCRYVVVDAIDNPYSSAVLYSQPDCGCGSDCDCDEDYEWGDDEWDLPDIGPAYLVR